MQGYFSKVNLELSL